MYLNILSSVVSQQYTPHIVLKCPHCGNNGTFNTLGTQDLKLNTNSRFYGMRRCPNRDCSGLVFFICKDTSEIVMSYPQQRIDFSKDNIPVNILQIFTEAVTCHSNECFIAAGMMIRKTLEAICEDKRATGANLHQKLESLKKLITVPTELLEAMYELKLLGNDAAHIVAKDFEEIGNEEIEISIEFAKEILKSVYQYQSLLSKLRGLKKPTI